MASHPAIWRKALSVLTVAALIAAAPGAGGFRALAQFTQAPAPLSQGAVRAPLNVEQTGALAPGADVLEGGNLQAATLNLEGGVHVADLSRPDVLQRETVGRIASQDGAMDIRPVISLHERLASQAEPGSGSPVLAREAGASGTKTAGPHALFQHRGEHQPGAGHADAVSPTTTEAEQALLEENPVTREGVQAFKGAAAAAKSWQARADGDVAVGEGGLPATGFQPASPDGSSLRLAQSPSGLLNLTAASPSSFAAVPILIGAAGLKGAALLGFGLAAAPWLWAALGVAALGGAALLAWRYGPAILVKARAAVARVDARWESATPADQARLPFSYWLFFSGAVLNQFGSWMGAVLIPLYAASQVSPEFAIIVQATLYAFLIVGNLVGASWARKYDSRRLFVAGGAGTALAILAAALTGSLGLAPLAFMAGFLAARALGGLSGGMVMGVGESTIMTELLGRNKGLLDRGNALYSIANFGMGFIAPLVAAFLVPLAGPGALIFVAAAALGLSLLPMLLIQLKPRAPAAAAGAAGPAAVIGAASEASKEPLPKAAKAAFIYSTFIRMAFFGLIGPLFAISVFGGGLVWGLAMAGLLVGANSLGNLIMALLLGLSDSNKERLRRIPVLGRLPYMTEKQALAATAAAWALFAAASFLAPGVPLLALAAAVILGVAVQAALTKWRSHIQSSVERASQPGVFKQLFNTTVGSLLLVFGLLKLAPMLAPLLGLGASMFGLLAGMSLGVALAGAVIAVAAYRMPTPVSKQ